MTEVRRETFYLRANGPVAVNPDLVLPPGRYTAVRKTIGLKILAGVIRWGKPTYVIELSTDQLAALGTLVGRHNLAAEIDVTALVKSGMLTLFV